MLRHFFTFALRGFRKSGGFALIIAGSLAIGLAACLLVGKYYYDETGFDRYHQKRDRIYRLAVQTELLSNGQLYHNATSSYLWGPALQTRAPGIERVVRFFPAGTFTTPLSDTWHFRKGEQEIPEEGILFAEQGVFDVFTWPLLAGDPAKALREPDAVVLSERAARKYFGSVEAAMGKALLVDGNPRSPEPGAAEMQLTVTGIMADIPRKSHLRADCLVSLPTLNRFFGGDIGAGYHESDWYWRGAIAYTYLLLTEGADPSAVREGFAPFLKEYVDEMTTSRGFQYELALQPLPDLHFAKEYSGNVVPPADAGQIRRLGLAALFILLLSVFNYINLSTARAAERTREIAVRKTLGVTRRSLVVQLLGESVLLALGAGMLAAGLARAAAPFFYQYLGLGFYLGPEEWPLWLGSVLLLAPAVGLLAGWYPAFYLSHFEPVDLFRPSQIGASGGRRLRGGLVVLQFIISIFFILLTLVAWRQVLFMKNHDLGIPSEQVLVIPPSATGALGGRAGAFKETVLVEPSVLGASLSRGVPGRSIRGDIYGDWEDRGKPGISMNEIAADFDFFDLYDLQLLAGRKLAEDHPGDRYPEPVEGEKARINILMNETAVRQFGWSTPAEALGRQVVRDPNSVDYIATVVGVFADFHFTSLQSEVGPLLLYIRPEEPTAGFLSLRLSGQDPGEALSEVRDHWRDFAPVADFDYFFVDEAFAELYEAEERQVRIFGNVALLAILLSCLGLLGLSTYRIRRRFREICIRKVLGASLGSIFRLLVREYLLLVTLASLPACLLGGWLANRWLADFPYRINLGASLFLGAVLLAVVMTLLTVGLQSWRAGRIQPVAGIREE